MVSFGFCFDSHVHMILLSGKLLSFFYQHWSTCMSNHVFCPAMVHLQQHWSIYILFPVLMKLLFTLTLTHMCVWSHFSILMRPYLHLFWSIYMWSGFQSPMPLFASALIHMCRSCFQFSYEFICTCSDQHIYLIRFPVQLCLYWYLH